MNHKRLGKLLLTFVLVVGAVTLWRQLTCRKPISNMRAVSKPEEFVVIGLA